MYMPFSYGFGLMQIMFFLIFGLVFIIFIAIAVRSFKTWSGNNRSPLLTVSAKVVSRRSDTHVHGGYLGSDAHMYSTTSFTDHYATFEVESGDRLELQIPENEYGYIVEGDSGRLSFKGTRFI